jgi:TolB-like protein/DNA-binding winged helix-turn-helix (wHTH) protein
MSLREGFSLGDWTVYPLEGRLVGEDIEQRVRPKEMDVLLCLAEHAGAVVERDTLLRRIWGERAQSDEPLTRCIGELRKALGDSRVEPNYILTVPKRGYQLLKTVVPRARDNSTAADASRLAEPKVAGLTETQRKLRLGTIKKIGFAFIILLVAAVTEVVIERWLDETHPDNGDDESLSTEASTSTAPDDRTIAVLPFIALSSGEDDVYFADGLTEELLNALSQLPTLQLTARTSSFFFKGKNLPIPEIAAHLNVAHIIEGSVRRDGDRLRITAQLIRVSDDSHLWSASYDRTLGDVFEIQEDIAENVAEVLGVMHDENARELMRKVGVRDIEAFIAYQKGLNVWLAAHTQFPFISEPLLEADAHFDRALVEAPGLTMARLMKADRHIHTILEVVSSYRKEQHPGEAQAALDNLLEQYDLAWQFAQPGNQRDIIEAERSLFSNDWSNVTRQIERALQPGGCPQMDWMKIFIGHFGLAERLIERTGETLACDPMDLAANYNLPWLHILAGDPEAALGAVDQAEEKGIRHPWLEDARILALLAAGRVDDFTMHGPGPGGSLMAYDRQVLREALAGNSERARQMAEEYWSGPEVDDLSSLVLAAVVGDRERANRIAARIDSSPGGAIVLSVAVLNCFCGAPFDLDAAPNLKARINEAGFHWPPPTSVQYPTKSW